MPKVKMEKKFYSLPNVSLRDKIPVPPRKPLPLEDVPRWVQLPYDTKYPLSSCSKTAFTFTTEELGKSLYHTFPRKDFELTLSPIPYPETSSYNSLHDPYLRRYFQSPFRYKNLLTKGLLTKDGKVKSSVKEYNHYRMYLYHLWAMEVNQLERHQMLEEKNCFETMLQARKSGDPLFKKLAEKYDRINADEILEEAATKVSQDKKLIDEHGSRPFVRATIQWKIHHENLQKNYRKHYPAIKQWLSDKTKHYKQLMEIKLNAGRNRDKKLRSRWEKIYESSRARLERDMKLRELEREKKRALTEQRYDRVKRLWAENDRAVKERKKKKTTDLSMSFTYTDSPLQKRITSDSESSLASKTSELDMLHTDLEDDQAAKSTFSEEYYNTEKVNNVTSPEIGKNDKVKKEFDDGMEITKASLQQKDEEHFKIPDKKVIRKVPSKRERKFQEVVDMYTKETEEDTRKEEGPKKDNDIKKESEEPTLPVQSKELEYKDDIDRKSIQKLKPQLGFVEQSALIKFLYGLPGVTKPNKTELGDYSLVTEKADEISNDKNARNSETAKELEDYTSLSFKTTLKENSARSEPVVKKADEIPDKNNARNFEIEGKLQDSTANSFKTPLKEILGKYGYEEYADVWKALDNLYEERKRNFRGIVGLDESKIKQWRSEKIRKELYESEIYLPFAIQHKRPAMPEKYPAAYTLDESTLKTYKTGSESDLSKAESKERTLKRIFAKKELDDIFIKNEHRIRNEQKLQKMKLGKTISKTALSPKPEIEQKVKMDCSKSGLYKAKKKMLDVDLLISSRKAHFAGKRTSKVGNISDTRIKDFQSYEIYIPQTTVTTQNFTSCKRESYSKLDYKKEVTDWHMPLTTVSKLRKERNVSPDFSSYIQSKNSLTQQFINKTTTCTKEASELVEKYLGTLVDDIILEAEVLKIREGKADADGTQKFTSKSDPKSFSDNVLTHSIKDNTQKTELKFDEKDKATSDSNNFAKPCSGVIHSSKMSESHDDKRSSMSKKTDSENVYFDFTDCECDDTKCGIIEPKDETIEKDTEKEEKDSLEELRPSFITEDETIEKDSLGESRPLFITVDTDKKITAEDVSTCTKLTTTDRSENIADFHTKQKIPQIDNILQKSTERKKESLTDNIQEMTDTYKQLQISTPSETMNFLHNIGLLHTTKEEETTAQTQPKQKENKAKLSDFDIQPNIAPLNADPSALIDNDLAQDGDETLSDDHFHRALSFISSSSDRDGTGAISIQSKEETKPTKDEGPINEASVNIDLEDISDTKPDKVYLESTTSEIKAEESTLPISDIPKTESETEISICSDYESDKQINMGRIQPSQFDSKCLLVSPNSSERYFGEYSEQTDFTPDRTVDHIDECSPGAQIVPYNKDINLHANRQFCKDEDELEIDFRDNSITVNFDIPKSVIDTNLNEKNLNLILNECVSNIIREFKQKKYSSITQIEPIADADENCSKDTSGIKKTESNVLASTYKTIRNGMLSKNADEEIRTEDSDSDHDPSGSKTSLSRNIENVKIFSEYPINDEYLNVTSLTEDEKQSTDSSENSAYQNFDPNGNQDDSLETDYHCKLFSNDEFDSSKSNLKDSKTCPSKYLYAQQNKEIKSIANEKAEKIEQYFKTNKIRTTHTNIDEIIIADDTEDEIKIIEEKMSKLNL